MGTYARPDFRLAPQPTAESAAFWTGGERGELLISKCSDCGHFFHPPGPVCFRCRSRNVGPEATSGRGVVAAYTINQQQWLPGLPPPYVVAMIELAEDRDVRVTSSVVAVDPADLVVGLEVEVFFEEWGEGEDRVWIPLFRPVGINDQGATA
ncbi:Zn-ribbon domain-containing OB-fold protein [Dietzia psychralcaliphila]|uniref:Zn-ribbon domain-containing OB-fold protein n=1 Tax=Dietzia psychralcaliphila TaxID=139021 RepID=UPI001C1E69C4|nr:Zn-ribbon domain-containing OB-fold protein [Dietzia psychralcaliphila]